MKHIEQALKEGYHLHGFSSGGGLRVLTMGRDNTNATNRKGIVLGILDADKYYSESITIWEALRVLDDDIKAGGRKYSEVYGPIEPHYWTGAYPEEDDNLDIWVKGGKAFDVDFIDGEFVIDMSQDESPHTPEEICQRVYKGETVYWTCEYTDTIFHSYPGSLGSGPSCTTGRIYLNEEKKQNYEWVHIERKFTGKTLQEALDKAKTVEYQFRITNFTEISEPVVS